MRDEKGITDLIAEAEAWSNRAHDALGAAADDAAQTDAYTRRDELAANYGEAAWELLDNLLAALRQEIPSRGALMAFVRQVAEMRIDGEDDGNGEEYVLENDDAWEMAIGLTGEARSLLGMPKMLYLLRQREAPQAYGERLRRRTANQRAHDTAFVEASNDVALRDSEW